MRLETGDTIKERSVEAIQRMLQVVGGEFILDNDGGPAVRLRKPVAAHAKPAKATPPAPGAKTDTAQEHST
jgi:hypothetical protein